MATFETTKNSIYYSFARAQNLKSINIDDIKKEILYTGFDFNINPMSIVIAVKRGEILYVIDEICLYTSNTQEACDELNSRYPNNKIWAYPDPSARQRKTSAGGLTDLTILANAGLVVKAPTSHTPVRDRINAVNSRLRSAAGIINLYIDPRCKHLIESLEKQNYKEGSSIPEKGGDKDYSHMNDALGYMVDYMFPINRTRDNSQGTPLRWTHQVTN